MRNRWLWVSCLVLAISGGEARGEVLTGTATTHDGRPAAGARVWATKIWMQQLERVETIAGDEGNFRLDLPAGRWILGASLGDEGVGGFVLAEITLGREPQPLELQLTPQGRLKGRLVEAETGRPIADARFVLDDGRDPTTDADGRFELPAVIRSRSHEAFVVASGRERKRVLFEMAEGPTTELEVPIPRGATIIGRVTDLEGQPIAGAHVGRATSGSFSSLTALWVKTDDEGRFVYDGVASHRSTWLGVEAPGFEESKRESLHVGADDPPLEVDFQLARKPEAVAEKSDAPEPNAPSPNNHRDVTGVVRGPNGKPVVAATVYWGVGMSSRTIETKTDERGAFRLTFVPMEANVVTIIPAESDLAPGLASVAAVDDQEVEIELANGLTLSGRIHSENGTPFTGVTVLPTVDVPGHRQLPLWTRKTESDAEGRFTVSGLPNDDGVKFTFLREGMTDLRDLSLPLDRDADVVASAAGAIRGRVVDADGRPVRNFRVLLNSSREPQPNDVYGGFFAGYCGIGLSYSSQDGSFLIRNLGAGSVQRVTILAPGYGECSIDRVIAEPLDVLSPDRADVYSLPKPHTLRVRVVKEGTEEPVAGVRAAIILEKPIVDENFAWGYHDATWGDSVQAQGGDNGVAEFSNLSFAEGTLTIQAPGYSRRNLGWRDGAEEVLVRLTPEAVVWGELKDSATGEPIRSAVVQIALIGGSQVSTTVNAGDAGRFRIDGLPPGDYGVTISVPFGPMLHTERLTLQAGQEARRDLSLSPRAAAAEAMAATAAPRFRNGDEAPDFEAKTLDDDVISLKDYRGKYVLLDFWATWCGPCVAEAPNLKAVHDAFGDDDRFTMISLSLDAQKTPLVEFLKTNQQPWLQVFLGDWSTDPVTKSYGVQGIPAILLIGPDGKIVAQNLRGTGISQAVAQALKEE